MGTETEEAKTAELALFDLLTHAIEHSQADPDAQANAILAEFERHENVVTDWLSTRPLPDDAEPPPLPSWDKDRIAQHFGWVDGVPACDVFPCEHGWDDRPSLMKVVTERDRLKATLADVRQWVDSTFGEVNDFSGLYRILDPDD